ncbi:MAG: hypothetical protein QME83_09780 [Thermodesulfobacteriota bacterium]|nr:hypothetical protein [Thermodesulfobacteriota bacterium]
MKDNKYNPHSSSVRRLLAHLKELTFPKEFRITFHPWPESIINAIQNLSLSIQFHPLDEQLRGPKEHFHLLADLGTGLWRMRNKMVKPGTDQPFEEMRRVYRHLESTWDALTQAGIAIQDHTNTRYNPGLSLKVMIFQPTKGLDHEKVIETIKPTIYYKGQSIQMGEVIVGRPEAEKET